MKRIGTCPGKQVGEYYIPNGVTNVWKNSRNRRWKNIYILSDGVFEHTSFLLPHQEKYAQLFVDYGYRFTDDWRKCDVIVAIRETEIPYFMMKVGKHLSFRNILLYTHEPYFSPRNDKMIRISKKDIPVMNVFTGDVWRNCLQYCPLQKAEMMSFVGVPKALNPVIALLATHKKQVVSAGNIVEYRNKIGLHGNKIGMVDIYGKGWPDDVVKGESRMIWRETKPKILSCYHFCLCFENTHTPYYVTEKIWDSILNYCLPIYMGSQWIYEIFPKDSFIDYSELGSPEKLFHMVFNMKPEEWSNRMNKCIEAFKKVAEQLDYDPMIESYQLFFKKMNDLINKQNNADT